jgi:hypothetical protein
MKEDEQDAQASEDSEAIPRVSFWSAMPKRSVSRIFLLLCALAGILYLRQKTGDVAGCMGEAFQAPYRPPTPTTIRGTVAIPSQDTHAP